MQTTTTEIATLSLSHEEWRILLRILNEQADQMRAERRRTENLDYHDELKHECHVLDGLVDKVCKLATPNVPVA